MRRLGFVSINDPNIESIALRPANAGGDSAMDMLRAQANAGAYQRAQQWIPGVDNWVVLLALGAGVVLIATRGRR